MKKAEQHEKMKFFLVAAAIFLALVPIAAAIPQPSAEFYGSVLMHGEPGVAALNITAFDSSLQCGNFTVKTAGRYGLLSCLGDDSDTVQVEGAAEGDNITFRINSTPAFVINGLNNWSTGSFHYTDILGLKNDSPYMYGCENATLPEDSAGSSVYIDLWVCAYDGNDNISDMTFVVSSDYNSSLISCYVSLNRYFTCNNPSQDANGLSYSMATVTNSLLLSWSARINVNVTPVNDAPYFVQNLTTQYTQDGANFSYKVNCSDIDGPATYYYDNTSLFNISSAGMINFSAVQADVGNHSIAITCGDGSLNTTQNFTLAVNDVNNPPTLYPIGLLQAAEDVQFLTTITAYDPDNDTLIFADNTSLFEINSTTGIINFTPSLSQVGNYSINISVTDDEFTAYEIINFTIRRGAFCGDTSCGGTEDCANCPADCGACLLPEEPSVEPGEGAGALPGTSAGFGGVGAGAGAAARAGGAGGGVRCTASWQCSVWGECIDSFQTRTCKDTRKCGTTANKPQEKRECGVVQPETCFDGIKNGNEEGIDCGGSCEKKCKRELFAGLQIPEIKWPEIHIGRRLPWLLILAILIISGLMVGGDQVYVKHIRKAPFAVHKEKARKYRRIRRMLYQTIFNILGLTLIASVYYYRLSTCPSCLIENIWMPGIIAVILPIAIAAMMKKLEYSEYKKNVAERRLKITHELQVKQLARLETKMLLQLEEQILDDIRKYMADNPETELAGFGEMLNELIKLHADLLVYKPLGQEAVKAIEEAAANEKLAGLSKEHFKIAQLIDDMKMLLANIAPSDGLLKSERHFMAGVEDVAADAYIMSILMSDENLTSLYNKLVDAYNAIKKVQADIKEEEKEQQKEENAFLSALKDFFDKKELAEANKGDRKWVKIFNLLVDINDHYAKKLAE
ncbi:MAG: Ig-like domain-containing protein [Candidatus Woesearchaeota archaeon]